MNSKFIVVTVSREAAMVVVDVSKLTSKVSVSLQAWGEWHVRERA
jgi:hypothetical protein